MGSAACAVAGVGDSRVDRGLMLDCHVVQEPVGTATSLPDMLMRWELVNSGSAPWPEGTRLIRVGGSADVVERESFDINPLQPQEKSNVEVPLIRGRWTVCPAELQPEGVTASSNMLVDQGEVRFALTTPEGRLFGPLLVIRLQRVAQPNCIVVSAPGGGQLLSVERGRQYTLEWWLANLGTSAWPEDLHLSLLAKSSGMQLCADAASMKIPVVQPHMTVQVMIATVTPSRPGTFLAKWAIRSPTYPDFEQILSVELRIPDSTGYPQSATTDAAQHSVGCPQLDALPSLRTADSMPSAPPQPPADPALLTCALQRLHEHADWDKREGCYTTLLKILTNIHLSPSDPKFRRLPVSSQKLAATVFDVPGGRDVLHGVGFAADTDVMSLPSSVCSVEATLQEVRMQAEKAAMERKRRERDARIQAEKELASTNILPKGRKLDAGMLETLAKVKEDQELREMWRNKPDVQK